MKQLFHLFIKIHKKTGAFDTGNFLTNPNQTNFYILYDANIQTFFQTVC